ncbi:MGDG synthase family glycosyltransferase [Neobacillus sp. LXY-4]|uniref:MGDG synthase family glycosyltransferase n=1 Tax=Neobacillus sp. LXY-4 TaxID=3379826 RepID=UPI003EE3DE46
MRKPKVLILTTNYGNGHLQVARALEEQFKITNAADVVSRDIYQETNPRLHEWTKKLYLKSYTKSGRQIYRFFYYGSQEITKRKYLSIFPYGSSKLGQIIAVEQPDAIINTFPTLAVPHFLKKTNTNIPTYNVVTDYCLHHSWIHPAISKYYVATQRLKKQLAQNGIHQNKISITGIPVQSQFEQSLCRPTLFNKYQLNPNRKTVLIVAGAYGVSKEIKTISEGLKNDDRLQILIVCGRNHQLYDQLRMKFQRENNIKVFGYVTNMAELFELATCVITKPGGIILSEALNKTVPIVLPRATPGQETENALFFHRHRAAILQENSDHLVKETLKLVYDEVKLVQMKASLKKIHVPNAADTIMNDVLQTYYWETSQNQLTRV